MKQNSFNYGVAQLAGSQLKVKMTGDDKSVLRTSLRKAIFFRTILGLLGGYLCFYLLHALTVVVTYHNQNFLLKYYILIHLVIVALLYTGYLFLNLRTIYLFEDLRNGAKEILVDKITFLLKSIHVIKVPNLIDHLYPLYNDIHFFYLQSEKYWIQTDLLTFESAEPGRKVEIHRGLKSGIVLQAKL